VLRRAHLGANPVSHLAANPSSDSSTDEGTNKAADEAANEATYLVPVDVSDGSTYEGSNVEANEIAILERVWRACELAVDSAYLSNGFVPRRSVRSTHRP